MIFRSMAEDNQRKSLEQRAQMSELERLRHSAAHVLATAIAKLWPDAQFAAGPPVENGFYYDVELSHRISPEDFESIEAEMTKVVKENQTFEKISVSREEALGLAQKGRLAALGERDSPSTFKVDLLADIPEEEEISIYKNGDFWDLCAGPHVPRTGNCKAFKLMSVASAFYKGDANNPQLQRVYGTAFKNKTQLGEHLEQATKVMGVLALYPPTDFLSVSKDFDGLLDYYAEDSPVTQLLGESISTAPRKSNLASPLRLFEGTCPPTFLLHGDADPIVPVDQSVIMHEKLLGAGIDSQLMRIPGYTHGDHRFNQGVAVEKITAFLKDLAIS